MRTPYSVQSFIAIVERESRSGKDISQLSREVSLATKNLKDNRERYLREITLVEPGSAEHRQSQREYYQRRAELRTKRDQAVQKAANQIRSELEENHRSMPLWLHRLPEKEGRRLYSVGNNLSILLPMKQAALQVKYAHAVRTPGRNSTVRSLKESLDKKYNHAIYRTDISCFFDSIDHKKLTDILSSLKHMDSITLGLCSRLLEEFAILTGSNKGIPQGVGLSSQLADAYLCDLDREIRSIEGVLFYARYVDDIVIVAENSAKLTIAKSTLRRRLHSLGLRINGNKSNTIVTTDNGDYPKSKHLRYLGYSFRYSEGSLHVDLTLKRRKKYKDKLSLATRLWLNTNPSRESPNHGNDGILVDRIRYLTGNTRLLNSKSNVAIGIYFSNSALDDTSKCLNVLDAQLTNFIKQNKSKMSDKLYEKLSAHTFVGGFANQTFVVFKRERTKAITQCWRDV